MEMEEIKERILVIDDDRAMCELIAQYLADENFVTDTVSSSPEGLEKALAGDYALIVLDVMMPKMNGFEVLRRLRATSETPVLAIGITRPRQTEAPPFISGTMNIYSQNAVRALEQENSSGLNN